MKKWHGLGLFLTGILFGIVISFAPELQASSSKLLGSKIGNVLQVELDGKNIGEGGVIGGTTYVPLRSVASNLDVEVVRVTKNEVVLSSGPDVTDVNMDKINAQRDAIISEIRILNVAAEKARSIVEGKDETVKYVTRLEKNLEGMKKFVSIEDSGYSQSDVDSIEKQIQDIQDSIKDAETNLPLYESKIADLEAQLAALEE